MSTFSASEPKALIRNRMIGLLLVLLGGAVCLARAYVAHKSSPVFGIDFRAVYGSGRCLISGCNPYYFADIRAEFLKQGGTVAEAMTSADGPFQPYFVGYPPPTLFYLAPFALLHWPLALTVYLTIAIALYVLAVILFCDLCSGYNSITASACFGLFLAVQARIVWCGQPTLLAAALLCIAMWCLLKNRFPWLGVLSFAISLVLKPPLGAFFLLYFLLASPSYRRRAWQVIALTVVLCAPALLWFATHAATRNWVQNYRANLVGISAQGNVSDPGPQGKLENSIIDLQTIVSHYRDEPAFYNRVVGVFSVVVLALWLYPVIRRRSGGEKDLLCLAAIGAFSMLPVYHRVYDTRALLVLFPAVALLLQRTFWWGRFATIAAVLMSLVLSDWYAAHSYSNSSFIELFGKHRLLQIAMIHAAPFTLLAVALFYLTVLYTFPLSLALTQGSGDHIVREPQHDYLFSA